uniref:Uncharacterized protein n=1 Tax=Graphocephala atropunctata TaxID=36148 RepID=A0A1B6MUJ1_9HEMI
MGVLEPSGEAFTGEVPATPPGLRDLGEDSGEEDLFAESTREAPSIISYSHDLSFKHIIPLLPAKGELELLEHGGWQQNQGKKYCSGCLEDVKRDLGKLADAVDTFRVERDVVKKENEALKKEVEALKKLLKEKEDKEKGEVVVTIENPNEDPVEVLVRKRNFEHARSVFNKNSDTRDLLNTNIKNGIQSFSVSLPRENNIQGFESKSKRSVDELRREFFAREFQSEQKTFTSENYLEIQPEEKKASLRSRLNIRIKPKKRIIEIISKLTSKFGASKVVPEAPQISMFQRFEKTRVLWASDAERKVLC